MIESFINLLIQYVQKHWFTQEQNQQLSLCDCHWTINLTDTFENLDSFETKN